MLKDEAMLNILAALAVVFIVSLLLIGNVKVACVTLLGVACSLVDILGIMHYWDINLNSISVINLRKR